MTYILIEYEESVENIELCGVGWRLLEIIIMTIKNQSFFKILTPVWISHIYLPNTFKSSLPVPSIAKIFNASGLL